jgi:hypothetical protein
VTVCRALVGRDDEMSRLVDAIQKANDRTGSFVVVRGAAGLGKSRLVREASTWAASHGGTVLGGRCAAQSGESSLRPIREALMGLARSGHRPTARATEAFLPALGRLVPDWATGDSAEVSPVVVAEGVLRVLEDVSKGALAMLVLDDVQWADPDTAEVIDYLADHIADSPIVVVVTLRDAEPGAGAQACDRIVARGRCRVQLLARPARERWRAVRAAGSFRGRHTDPRRPDDRVPVDRDRPRPPASRRHRVRVRRRSAVDPTR